MPSMEPSEVVRRAYAAANAGRWSVANRDLCPQARKDARSAVLSVKASVAKMRGNLPSLKPKQRAAFMPFIRVMEELITPPHGFAWKADTAPHSIRKLSAIRQAVRLDRATVSFQVEWRDGSVDRDRVQLVRQNARWLLKDRTNSRTPVIGAR